MPHLVRRTASSHAPLASIAYTNITDAVAFTAVALGTADSASSATVAAAALRTMATLTAATVTRGQRGILLFNPF